MAIAEQEDPDPYISGSYDDVVVAHSRGRLTDSEYETLVDAIAEAGRTEEAKDGERDAGRSRSDPFRACRVTVSLADDRVRTEVQRDGITGMNVDAVFDFGELPPG
jgi:hypothetical protein